MATTFGADWVVAQMSAAGRPASCWVLHNTSVANEGQSDGLHWLNRDGHLIHIAGWIDRVQVSGSDFAGAGRQIGVTDITACNQE